MKFLYLMPLFLWLVACATPDLKNASSGAVNWKLYQKNQNLLQSWTIKGRLSVQTEYEGGQLDYGWQQHNLTDYDIGLRAPMGAGTTIINGRKNGVSIKTSSGNEYFDTDVDRLIKQLNGWPLPVSGLQFWVRGIPAPTSRYEVSEWSGMGLPHVILQDGWRIEFRRYKDKMGNILLSKLFINRPGDEEVDVRLLVRQWVIGTEIK